MKPEHEHLMHLKQVHPNNMVHMTSREVREFAGYITCVLGHVADYARELHQTEENRYQLMGHIHRAKRLAKMVYEGELNVEGV